MAKKIKNVTLSIAGGTDNNSSIITEDCLKSLVNKQAPIEQDGKNVGTVRNLYMDKNKMKGELLFASKYFKSKGLFPAITLKVDKSHLEEKDGITHIHGGELISVNIVTIHADPNIPPLSI